ncbi:Rsm22-domain-containing protein [Artomyces pyxidatus]|uniref:Rsm22-domain-containing protein n=1 Tax=Artomyces pyxidatus TaxID=48021 RepID=A0ACB8THX0_9AGAM|nr:Rsm22-domain-containing protein [Artomyces pyxidatus]
MDDGLATLEDEEDSRTTRKSPAALFGSEDIGAVVLPAELQAAITTLISESDKRLVHNDAKRLFLEKDDDADWDPNYDAQYKSRKQASQHAERDGTAFASVALPAHYSAIYAVLHHVKHRLGAEWRVEHLIDWGAGTGSGLWAAAHAFQRSPDSADQETQKPMHASVLRSYTGIDRREGLVTIGKRLLRDIDHDELAISWQKSFHEDDKSGRTQGVNSVALSAFFLSSLKTHIQQRAMIKEMWESGADTVILIDHNTRAGFGAIVEAREYLLNMGKREMEDHPTDESQIRGSHVVAPCPHDGACPLYHSESTRLVCGFSQRLQRPPFVRLTKHSGAGHEDTGYSYVVIRRGVRPSPPATEVGRIGEVGKREMRKLLSQTRMTELQLHDETPASPLATESASQLSESPENAVEEPESQNSEIFGQSLRSEAFHWPRVVFPPLKRSGHVILDVCAPEGNINRMTIPKSQGKQPYYDARKARWGDIFPHEPKNPPQVRYQPTRAKREGGTTPTRGVDIGKRGFKIPREAKTSYQRLSNELKDRKRGARRDRRLSAEEY